MTELSDTKAGNAVVKNIFEWIELFAVSVAVVMIVLVCFGRHSPVIGASMNETLQEDDLLIISDLFYEPKQGDVIVFASKETTYEKPYVKRIIATENQTVDYDPSTGAVTVDGKLINEPYATYKGTQRMFYSNIITYPYKVPEGHVFVMGDNRWNSNDSRSIGAIDERSIIGRVIFRLFPFDQIGTVD